MLEKCENVLTVVLFIQTFRCMTWRWRFGQVVVRRKAQCQNFLQISLCGWVIYTNYVNKPIANLYQLSTGMNNLSRLAMTRRSEHQITHLDIWKGLHYFVQYVPVRSPAIPDVKKDEAIAFPTFRTRIDILMATLHQALITVRRNDVFIQNDGSLTIVDRQNACIATSRPSLIYYWSSSKKGLLPGRAASWC